MLNVTVRSSEEVQGGVASDKESRLQEGGHAERGEHQPCIREEQRDHLRLTADPERTRLHRLVRPGQGRLPQRGRTDTHILARQGENAAALSGTVQHTRVPTVQGPHEGNKVLTMIIVLGNLKKTSLFIKMNSDKLFKKHSYQSM